MEKINSIGFVLFDGFETLDLYGPLECFGKIESIKIITVAQKKGPIKSAQSASTVADYSFEDCPKVDALLVPGGIGTRREVTNPLFIDWLRNKSNETPLVMSVCSGSALLAKAGLLEGKKATSNKKSFKWVTEQGKADWVYEARWIWDDKYVTSSGVSAGIDMSLHVIEKYFGKEESQNVANIIEYTVWKDSRYDPFSKLYKHKL
eukprot:c30475_g1_i1.p1 GENE.c30475_g1_i1~~c30475_g1_i1.p1  ORF type:complete len:205 (+),score=80.95 c30475_g1_i1:25-639(+)